MLFFLKHGYRVGSHEQQSDPDTRAAASDAKWGARFRSPKDFIGVVFQGVWDCERVQGNPQVAQHQDELPTMGPAKTERLRHGTKRCRGQTP